MRADFVARCDAIFEEGANRARMKPCDMIAFQKRIHDQLAIAFDRVRLGTEQMRLSQGESVKILTQNARMGEICIAEIGIGSGREPDKPAYLARRQFG